MPKKTERKGGMSADEVYATIWKVEQDHNRTRWTVTTFFLGLSFAIFGFSFRENISGNALIPQHGGYRRLRTFQAAEVIHDATRLFCHRFVDRCTGTRPAA